MNTTSKSETSPNPTMTPSVAELYFWFTEVLYSLEEGAEEDEENYGALKVDITSYREGFEVQQIREGAYEQFIKKVTLV